MIALAFHQLFLEHGEEWHPENASRLRAVLDHLARSGWMDRLSSLEFGPATREQVAWLHEEDYIETLEEVCQEGGGLIPPDTPATSQTYAAALMAAGACITAAANSVRGDLRKTLCLVRPPGHHALRNRAMGFCFFNNAALAAEAALRAGVQRVAIVDFDVHHGNGTQDAFYHRRDVLYISLHEDPHYPFTGTVDEVGIEDGAGFTLNLPMRTGACDRHYEAAFQQVVGPALDEYQPQLVLVSAGYDAHHADPLAHLNLTIGGFHMMMSVLAGAAERQAEGRIVVVLEGGYSPEWLALGIDNTLRALAGDPPLPTPDPEPPVHPLTLERVEAMLEHVIETHRRRLALP